MKVVDLFCGAGGFSLGMRQAGHTIVGGFDLEPEALAIHNANFRKAPLSCGLVPAHKLPAFRRKRPGAHFADLLDLLEWVPIIGTFRPDIIVGGPPCQPFSSAGSRIGDNDPKAILTVAFATITAAVQPRYFLMENVPGLSKWETFEKAISTFRGAGYGLTIRILNARDYGSVQDRQRVIVAGCHGETDGWLNEYLDEARLDQVKSIGDVLGAEFGPLLFRKGWKTGARRSFWRMDEACPTITSQFLRGNKDDYILREADVRILQAIEEEIPFLAQRSETLAAGVRIPGGELPIATVEQAALLAGFPPDYNWAPMFTPLSPQGSGRPLRPRAPNKTELIQMIANSVSPPFARALGDCLEKHRKGCDPVIVGQDHYSESDFFAWLREEKRFDQKRVAEVHRLLGIARGLIAARELTDLGEEYRAFEILIRSRPSLRANPDVEKMRKAMELLYECSLWIADRPLPWDTSFNEHFEVLREQDRPDSGRHSVVQSGSLREIGKGIAGIRT